jgi:hypothetical protein
VSGTPPQAVISKSATAAFGINARSSEIASLKTIQEPGALANPLNMWDRRIPVLH